MASTTINLTSSAIDKLENISSAASTSGSYYQTSSASANGGTLFIRIQINLRTATGHPASYVNNIKFSYSIAQQRTAGAKGEIQTGYKNSSGGDTLTSATHTAGQGSGLNQYGVYSSYTDTIIPYISGDTATLVMKIRNPILLNACAYRIKDVSFVIDYTVPTYTATFQNYDGTILQTVSVQSGSTPSYTGATPTKTQDVQYTYEFSGWSPVIGAITANTTYTAQFKAVLRKYKIAIDQPEHGAITGAVSGEYEYGTKLTLTATPKEGYYFDGWLLEYWHDTSLNMYDNPLEFIVLGEEIISARIFKKQATIILTLDDNNGSVTGVAVGKDGTETNLSIGENIVDVGAEITLTATPNKGYMTVMRVILDVEEDSIISIPPRDYETNSISFTVLDKGTQEIQVFFTVQSIRNIQLGTQIVEALFYNEQTKTVYFVVDEYVEIEPTGADTVDGLNFAVTVFDNLPENVKPIMGVQIGTKYVFKD